MHLESIHSSTFCPVTVLFQNRLHFLFTSKFCTWYPKMKKWGKDCWNSCKSKAKIWHVQYVSIYTLLKYLCQHLKLQAFLSMMLQAWHIYFRAVSPIHCTTSEAPSGWMVHSHFQISPENQVQTLALAGHLRTFTVVLQPLVFILAVCLGACPV